ncbi:MAG: bifunctional aldolase/short-chain dehydrogenase [Armatimonadetes bacterium]|nr:bifunctional aldolase/short-chain dehydrogenase [Armatimonadota bacterium]
MPENLWNDAETEGLDRPDLLAYRSRLLASDRAITNIFGGNTSSKAVEKDHLGRDTRVLWVKGSGSDMAGCTGANFAGLRLDEILPLRERDEMSDAEMVAYLARCTFEPGRPRQSIETLLHAFLPFTEIDHSHPDAILALACCERGRAAAQEVFGERAAWVEYTRPGFALSKVIVAAVETNPQAECAILAKHGLVTWGQDGRSCYESTIRVIAEAEATVRESSRKVWTGAPSRDEGIAPEDFLPELRGAISEQRKQILCLDTSARALQMVNTPEAEKLSRVGAACPDHLVHVKSRPLFLRLDVANAAGHTSPERAEPAGAENPSPLEGEACSPAVSDKIRQAVQGYRAEYDSYFRENAAEGDEVFDSAPRVALIPGMGVVTAGRDAFQAQVSRQLYQRAIEVMEGAEAMGGYVSLSPREAFDIEYWPLELYKLRLKPPERELAGHIALITGGGSGIGRATAFRLAEEGAHLCIADINESAAEATAQELREKHGYERAIAASADVSDEAQVQNAFRRCILEWGGLDILVCSAGIAFGAPIEETTEADWERNFGVLAKGYFLPAREAFRVWRRQGIGGSLVFVVSKNAIAAGKNASAYSAAKAAELHLARCLAEEGGAIGVRVNSVLPDAVLQGSSIWDGAWREQRAAAYGIEPEELEEFYRNRTTLKRSVYPPDVAEAILFLAGPRAEKTTGAALTVDAGVPGVYVR